MKYLIIFPLLVTLFCTLAPMQVDKYVDNDGYIFEYNPMGKTITCTRQVLDNTGLTVVARESVWKELDTGKYDSLISEGGTWDDANEITVLFFKMKIMAFEQILQRDARIKTEENKSI